MRCQRVRYSLSAYCRDELTERKRKAVAAHLQSCTECGREEMFLREIGSAGGNLTGPKLSADFNSKLLSRIAQERFRETRTRAYFPPKRVPLFSWSRAIPIAATACLVLAFVLNGGVRESLFHSETPVIAQTSSQQGLDDRYLTVQPEGQHALVVHKKTSLGGGQWAFHKELARVNRIKGFVNSLASQTNFSPYTNTGTENLILPLGPGLFLQILNNPPAARPLTNGEPLKPMEASQTY